LSSVALIVEILPEIESKAFVIPALLLIIIIGIIDLLKLKGRSKEMDDFNKKRRNSYL